MNRTILVIDDEEQIRTIIKKILEAEGYNVVVAGDGKEGLKAFNESPVDLVITDIIMPEKEGIEIIRDLKNNSENIKIIAISGGGNIGPDEYLFLAKKLGVDMTLAKPFRRNELISAVSEVLD